MAKKNAAQQEKAENPAPEPEVQEDPVAVFEAKVVELEDKLLRARADYDNLQKRHMREAELERDRSKARVLEPFLQVFEFAQMAATEAEKTPGALAEGVKMLVREFDRAITDQGIHPFGTTGDAFDPNLHEATGEADVPGIQPGHISGVMRPGYKLGERVLRYAKVTIQPAPAAASADDTSNSTEEE